MGVHTMSFHGDGGGALSRQGSVYSLTMNEVESHLGEPLRSMNLDDLLRTILPSAAGGGGAGEPHRKTVDEVWRDIQGGARHATAAMGEMTLEDFLSRAGVSVGAGGGGAHWLRGHYPPPPAQQLQYPVARPLLGVGSGQPLDAAVYRDGHGGVAGLLTQMAGRKRGGSGDGGVVEKTVERRQKRMIKNRESAARSRARKQAYTNELENKISRLEEENQRLREQKAVADFSTFPSCVDFLKAFLTQKLEPVVQFVPQPEPKQELRRTNSASF